jgi:putative transposase
MLVCCRYIETNPVRSGLVDKPSDYRWSSYAHNAQGHKDEMITPSNAYQRLGASDRERAKAYRKLFRPKLSDQQVQDITDSARKGWVLGDAKFAAKIEQLSGRRATPLPRGRPRKQ